MGNSKKCNAKKQRCNASDTPAWLQDLEDLEEQAKKAYVELIETSIQRNKTHQKAARALDEAVGVTERLTLDFLNQLNYLNNSEDSD